MVVNNRNAAAVIHFHHMRYFLQSWIRCAARRIFRHYFSYLHNSLLKIWKKIEAKQYASLQFTEWANTIPCKLYRKKTGLLFGHVSKKMLENRSPRVSKGVDGWRAIIRPCSRAGFCRTAFFLLHDHFSFVILKIFLTIKLSITDNLADGKTSYFRRSVSLLA